MKEFSRSMLWIGIFALSSFYPVVGQAGIKNSHHESSSSSESSATAQPISAYGTWTPLNNQPQFPGGIPGVGFPLLLTDGTILVQNLDTPHTGQMWKLIPDHFGSYQNGTWEQVASLPAGYAPLYQASAVLADGRVVYAGGEYNGPDYDVVWTSLGAIYDPVADFWTPIAPPPFFDPDAIGDAQSVVFKDGTFMVANALSKQSAILDLNTLTWTETGTSTKLCSNNEEGWVLLKSGKVFTVDCHATAMITTDQPGVGPFYSEPAGFSIVNNLPAAPVTAQAALVSPDINACTAPLNDLTGKIALWDWNVCGSGPVVTNIQATHAVGALGAHIQAPGMAGRAFQTIYFGLLEPADSAALRAAVAAHPNMLVTIHPPLYDSELYDPATGTWSSAGAPIESLIDAASDEIGPSVLRPDGTVFTAGGNGNTGVYDSYSGQWFKGPKLPVGPGLEGQLGCQDAPGVLLPNGNVLFVAGPTVPTFSPPAHFFEFDGANLIEQAKLPDATFSGSYLYNMLVLPTGEVLTVNLFNLNVNIYKPGNPNYNKEWAPVITCAPKKVKREHTYTISGIRFNGMSQTSMYGDDYQAASNYPLVRITELATGRVVYCRTHDHSSMAVASDDCVYTYFDVPYYIEPGKYQLEVVANGIPSDPIHITVK